MSKHRYGFDEKKIERFYEEGRGKGHGADYKPWLTIQDVPSDGLASRVPSVKTDRHHELLSNNETALFLLADWSDNVFDVREQFPLDRELTRRIAREMGVRHPVDTHSRVDLGMTTDLLIDLKIKGRVHCFPRAVKPADMLNDPRVVEKLEIERRYWLIKEEPWALVTDRDLPKVRIQNLRWLHEMQTLAHTDVPYPDYWRDRCEGLLRTLSRATSMTIRQFTSQLEGGAGFRAGDALTVIRHLAANKRIGMDLDKPFSADDLISNLWILVDETRLGRRA